MNWHTLLSQLDIIILVLILLKMHGFEAAPVGQNYIVIIDAGSSGSRMFVYTWQTKAESSSGLEDVDILKDRSGNPIVKKQTPGLSSFANKTSEVPAYISSLLDFAVLHIPLSSQPDTQLFIMATAGMRLLSSAEQGEIWKTVRHHVASTYRFKFRGSNAYTISGTEEGLFGWIAVNYLLGRFRLVPGDKGHTKQPTDGMLDMGGASMQIAYELQSTDDLPDTLVSEFSLTKNWYSTSQHYKLYVKSYLGFGMNAFRQRYEEYLFRMNTTYRPAGENPLIIYDPCLLDGFTVNNELDPPSVIGENQQMTGKVSVQFTGTGNMDQCMQNVIPLLHLNHNCLPLPCAMDNIVQLDPDFTSMEFYGLSEFYYTLETLKVTPPVGYNYSLVLHKTQEICSTPWTTYLSKLKKENPNLSKEKFDSFVSFKKLICFKASYLLSAFHKGLHFPTDYDKFIPTLEINNTELQWSLGALLYKLKATTSKEEYQRKIIFISVVVICTLIILIFVGTILYLKLRNKCSRTNKQSQNGSVTANTNNIESFVKSNNDASSRFDDKIASS